MPLHCAFPVTPVIYGAQFAVYNPQFGNPPGPGGGGRPSVHPLRILFITDIHSNFQGMEACLAAAPEHDRIVNLGDIVGYGGSPNEVTGKWRPLGGLLVRGNHDKACTGITGIETFNPIAGLAALWTKGVLTPENLEWLRVLPQGPIPLDGVVPGAAAAQTIPPDAQPATPKAADGSVKVECVHGSPLDEDEYIIVMRDAVEPLTTTQAALTFFGHTHIQGGFSVHGDRWDTLRPIYSNKKTAESCVLQLRPDGKYLINPGSAGQPRDGDWRVAFCTFDTEAYTVTFFRVPYDLKGAQEAIRQAKLPERLASRLADGR